MLITRNTQVFLKNKWNFQIASAVSCIELIIFESVGKTACTLNLASEWATTQNANILGTETAEIKKKQHSVTINKQMLTYDQDLQTRYN